MRVIAPFFLAVLACSCAGPRSSHISQHATDTSAASSISTPPTNSTAAVAGTWNCPDQRLLWELASDGHWKWWDLEEQSGHPAEPPAISGKWFIHDGILVLRVENGTSHIPAGLAFTYDVRSVAAQTMVLYEADRKEQITLRRAD